MSIHGKHSLLLAAAIGLAGGLAVTGTPEARNQRKHRPVREPVRTWNTPEIEAWNKTVDERKAAKKARKA